MLNTRTLLPIGLVALALVGCSDDDDNSSNTTLEPTQTERALAVLDSIASGDITDFTAFVSADNYTQHNLGFPDGRATLSEAIDSGALSGTTVENVRVFEDNDIVFLHSIYGGTWNGGVPQVGFDVFRFEEGQVVEHWDNLANVEDDGDDSTQTNGTLTIDTTVDTESSRTLVANTMQALFINGEWSTVTDYFDEENYQQHSVGAGTDFTGISQIAASIPEGSPFYSSMEYLYADHDFVLTMSEGFPDADTGLSDAYYDLFRVADGQIVEHWDIIQSIPDESTWANLTSSPP
ncbi:nuclear transport factor 2 family protein [Granulosicoccus antarcticus]|uniref:SnoaL-like domain-containing protein n=1 Tax=Granulosicoccus antarcticus IMCC3135 TaxID=1192854 RepID=A0A2Z2NVU0_9GAMM|nr:nuclear transport factor 2 family protein [Granulosicoccus antarcticus]ASJ74151.1 hypothetical protein IMCC3135_20365 [Granulosicoccus antarcticus IMCC3135]